MRNLLSPSGGLVYHLRAWRYRQSLWAPFASSLENWLENSWNPPRNAPLLLIGSSAGWCLPLSFLKSFAMIHAVDLDPLALWLLKKRLQPQQVHTRKQEGLGILESPPGSSLMKLLQEDSLRDASVLFCNLWGQLSFEETLETALPTWAAALERALSGRRWASFFDRVSGSLPPEITPENLDSAESLADRELIARFYSNSCSDTSTPVELLDHGTADFFKTRPRRHLSWELEPGRYHLIEAIHS